MRRPRVALAVLASFARETLLVRPGEGLDGLRLADLVAAWRFPETSSQWLSQL